MLADSNAEKPSAIKNNEPDTTAKKIGQKLSKPNTLTTVRRLAAESKVQRTVRATLDRWRSIQDAPATPTTYVQLARKT
jgi:hypothetical protein